MALQWQRKMRAEPSTLAGMMHQSMATVTDELRAEVRQLNALTYKLRCDVDASNMAYWHAQDCVSALERGSVELNQSNNALMHEVKQLREDNDEKDKTIEALRHDAETLQKTISNSVKFEGFILRKNRLLEEKMRLVDKEINALVRRATLAEEVVKYQKGVMKGLSEQVPTSGVFKVPIKGFKEVKQEDDDWEAVSASFSDA